MSYGTVIDGIVFAVAALYLVAIGIRNLALDWPRRSRPDVPGESG